MTTMVRRDADGAGLLIDLIGETKPERAEALRAIADVSAGVHVAVSAATTDKALTPYGVQRSVARALTTAAEQLRKHQASEDKAAAALATRRAEALTAWSGEAPPPEVIREIRDTIRAQGTDPISVGANLVAAVEAGDTAYVHAVTTAPLAFPLTSAEWIQQGADLAVERSPLAAKVSEAETELAEHRGVVTAVKHELGKVANEFGLGSELAAELARKEAA